MDLDCVRALRIAVELRPVVAPLTNAWHPRRPM
jgi:hypothetical protein